MQKVRGPREKAAAPAVSGVVLNVSFISYEHSRKSGSIKGPTACLALLSLLQVSLALQI